MLIISFIIDTDVKYFRILGEGLPLPQEGVEEFSNFLPIFIA